MKQKQERALIALLTHPTREAAAKAAGIASSTLRRYLDDPEFIAAYKKAIANMMEDATRQAQQSLNPALSTLREILEDDKQNGQIRIQAARSLLEYSLRLTEITDIVRELEDEV